MWNATSWNATWEIPDNFVLALSFSGEERGKRQKDMLRCCGKVNVDISVPFVFTEYIIFFLCTGSQDYETVPGETLQRHFTFVEWLKPYTGASLLCDSHAAKHLTWIRTTQRAPKRFMILLFLCTWASKQEIPWQYNIRERGYTCLLSLGKLNYVNKVWKLFFVFKRI